jgi:hypothetical protein
MHNVSCQSGIPPTQLQWLSSNHIMRLPEQWLFQGALSFVAAMLAAAAMVVLCHIVGTAWLEPYDLVLGALVIVLGLVLAIATRNPRWLSHPLFLIATAFLCVNHHVSWSSQCLVLSASLGILVYCYGSYWIHFCTPAPQWRCQLATAAAISIVLTATLFLSGWTVPRIAIVTLPVAALFTPSPNGLRTSRWRVIFHSICLWGTYKGRLFFGSQKYSCGPLSHRRALTAFASALVAVVLAGWPDSPFSTSFLSVPSHCASVTPQLDSVTGALGHLYCACATSGPPVLALAVLSVVAVHLVTIALVIPILMEAAACRDQVMSLPTNTTLLVPGETVPLLTGPNSDYRDRNDAHPPHMPMPPAITYDEGSSPNATNADTTSVYVSPIVGKMATPGDGSIIVLDLKADSFELFAILRKAVSRQTPWFTGPSSPNA